MLKKSAISILLSLFSIFTLSAQHMSFLGVQMGTNVDTFKKQLLQKEGFRDQPVPYSNIAGVRGPFAGYDAAITIVFSSKSRIVAQVVASFPDLNYDTKSVNADRKEAIQLEAFDAFKKSLTKKYGRPARDIDKPSGSFIKWCHWETEFGPIILEIAAFADNPHYRKILVSYEDKKTALQKKTEDEADL